MMPVPLAVTVTVAQPGRQLAVPLCHCTGSHGPGASGNDRDSESESTVGLGRPTRNFKLDGRTRPTLHCGNVNLKALLLVLVVLPLAVEPCR